MAQIDVLEVKVVEQCNYSCVGCGSFSNLAAKEEYGYDEMRKDLTRMAEIFPRIRELRLYGGEPLLASNLLDYVKIARECLPDSRIVIITNGTLLHKKDEDFYATLKQYNTGILVSYYKINHEIIDQGMEKARQLGVAIGRSVIKYFYVKLKRELQAGDIQTRFSTCHAMCKGAVYLDHGLLFACPYAPNFRHYDKAFGSTYANPEDGYNIHQEGATPAAIVKKMRTALSVCAYCDDNLRYVHWQQGKAEEPDWLYEPDNQYIIENYDWYDFIIDENAISYLLLDVEEDNRQISPRVISSEELCAMNGRPLYVWLYDQYSLDLFNKVLQRDLLQNGVNITGVIKTFEGLDNAISGFNLITLEDLPAQYSIVAIYHYHGQRVKVIKDIKNTLGVELF